MAGWRRHTPRRPPTSLFRLIGPEGEDVNLTWSAEEGTQYTVERCVDLDGWEPVPGMEDLTTDEQSRSLTLEPPPLRQKGKTSFIG
ncbi:MAG: hypothetical protein R3F11_18185 [Verrucomicrobiales bacterium]